MSFFLFFLLLMSSCRKKLHGNSRKKWCFKETTSFLQVYTVIKVVTQNFSQHISKQTKKIFRGVFFQILCYQTPLHRCFLIGMGIFHSMYKHYFRMSLLFSGLLLSGIPFCHYSLQVSSGFSSATIIIA